MTSLKVSANLPGNEPKRPTKCIGRCPATSSINGAVRYLALLQVG